MCPFHTHAQRTGDEIVKTQTHDIHSVAAELDRLFSSDPTIVDATEVGWGLGTEAGHVGHPGDDEGESIVGWYCQGGNAGHPLLSIANEDIQRAAQCLAGLKTASSMRDIVQALTDAGVRFERLS